MILDLLDHAVVAHGLGPQFMIGLRWLAEFSPATPDGRYPIDGDNLFALVQSYDTLPAAEKKFESHRVYADIQFIVSGTESILYAPIEQLTAITPYDLEKDFLLYSDPPASTPLLLGPGSFAIFLPHDGHKPCCTAGEICHVKKVVMKVRV